MPEIEEPVIREGLPEGWTFTTVEQGDRVRYEVRDDQLLLIMYSTWNRSWLTAEPTAKAPTVMDGYTRVTWVPQIEESDRG